MFKDPTFAFAGRGAVSAFILAAALSGCAAVQAGNDAQISAAVEDSFARHPELGPPGVLQVETLNHVVYLNGIVYTDLQRDIANSVALTASNNAAMVNSIAVYNK